MEKKLQNDISIKDQGRLINAGFKLTPDTQEIKFSFDTKAIPCMVCGVEETPTFSQVELITSIRDFEGVNRLAVDISPSPGIPFQYSNSSLNDLVPFYTVPAGKTLYIIGVNYGNTSVNSGFVGLFSYEIEGGTSFLNVYSPTHTNAGLISPVPLISLPAGTTLYLSSGFVNPNCAFTMWGYYR